MKITIDTKEDSHEDIKKVISMLQNLIGNEKVYTNQGNIFETEKPAQEGTSDIFNSLFSNQNNESSIKDSNEASKQQLQQKEEDEMPEIIPY